MFLKDSGILRRARRVTKTSSWVLFLSHEVVVMPSTGVISTVRVVHGSIAFFTAIDEITFVSVPVFVEEYTLSGTLPVYEVSFVSLSVSPYIDSFSMTYPFYEIAVVTVPAFVNENTFSSTFSFDKISFIAISVGPEKETSSRG